MKQTYSIISILFIISKISTSCQLEISENGNLDGNWHLTKVDTLGTYKSKQLTNCMIYWAIQGKILQLSDKSYKHQECILKFSHNKDSLLLYNPLIYNRTNGDIEIKEISPLQPYGINSLNEKFKIETLNHSKMVLSNKIVRLHFVNM